MDIKRGEHVAVVVSREWINLRGVRGSPAKAAKFLKTLIAT